MTLSTVLIVSPRKRLQLPRINKVINHNSIPRKHLPTSKFGKLDSWKNHAGKTLADKFQNQNHSNCKKEDI